MHYSPILVPVVALVAWTLLVMLWMLVSRGARIPAAGDQLSKSPRARAAPTWTAGQIPRLSGSPTITIT